MQPLSVTEERVLTLLVKFSKTTVFLPVAPAQTSVRQLKEHVLAALTESRQPVDEQVGVAFDAVTLDDLDVFRQQAPAAPDTPPTYVTLAESRSPDERGRPAKDGSPLLSGLGLNDCDVVYVGWKRPGQGA